VLLLKRDARVVIIRGGGVLVVLLFRLIACLLLNAECVKSISIFWDLSGFHGC
jgi:hypothetical protein